MNYYVVRNAIKKRMKGVCVKTFCMNNGDKLIVEDVGSGKYDVYIKSDYYKVLVRRGICILELTHYMMNYNKK